MVEGKRLKNYLVYALGEIILVVIGILVAVNINNYNEDRKSEAGLVRVAEQIRQKLSRDLELINETRGFIREDLKLYNLYLKPNKTEDERLKVLIQTPFLVTINIQFLPLNPILSSAIDTATAHESLLSQHLLTIEQDYKVTDRTLQPMQDVITNELITNLNYIKDHFSWYENLVGTERQFTTEEYAYFFTDDYKNRVLHMRFLYGDGYDSILEDVAVVFEDHLKTLDELIATYK